MFIPTLIKHSLQLKDNIDYICFISMLLYHHNSYPFLNNKLRNYNNVRLQVIYLFFKIIISLLVIQSLFKNSGTNESGI